MKMKIFILFLTATALNTVVVKSNLFGGNSLVEPFADDENWPDIQHTVVQMPGVQPQYNDSYLCKAFPLNTDETHYIVGFESMVDLHQDQVHHAILYGCEQPCNEEEVWDCGLTDWLVVDVDDPIPNLLYAWTMGAPKLELPTGVGFRVGGETKNRFLVLQVHYKHGSIERKDYSGIRISSTHKPMPRIAATLLVSTDARMEPKKTEKLEFGYVMKEPVEIHPFAIAFHVPQHNTRRHGQKVNGWVVKETLWGSNKWNLLGEHNEQLPQHFEAVKDQFLTISHGDTLVCTIKNKRLIKIESTGEGEMCSFYLMYWVEGDKVLEQNTCSSDRFYGYYWSSSTTHVPMKIVTYLIILTGYIVVTSL